MPTSLPRARTPLRSLPAIDMVAKGRRRKAVPVMMALSRFGSLGWQTVIRVIQNKSSTPSLCNPFTPCFRPPCPADLTNTSTTALRSITTPRLNDSARHRRRRQSRLTRGEADYEDFEMEPILAEHEARLRASAPCRVASPLWQSRTPDAPTSNAPLFLPGSRDPTPFASYGWLQNPSMLREPMPHAYPLPDLRPQLPPIPQHPPAPSPVDLFAPGASFAQKRAHEDEERSQDEDASIAPRRPKRARRGLEGKSDDDETDGEEFHPPKSSFFLEPDTGSDADEEQKRPVSVFLDIAAEDSDEEGDDGEGDLKETLSDKEFLDDTPQQQSTHPPRPISRPHAAEEHDNALALARYFERRAEDEGYGDSDSDRGRASKPKAPALPAVEPALSRRAPTSRLQPIQTATWVRGRWSVYKGEILFVLSPCKVLYVPNSEESWIRFRDKKKFKQRAESGFMITNKDRKPWTNLSYKWVHRQLRQDLLPYYRCTHSLLLALRCDWPTPAFAEPRARVVAVDGPHKGRAGIIVCLVDEEEHGVIVKCADVQRIDADPTGTGHPFRVRLDHLERHELDPCYRFRPHDRVRVVDGALYDGLLGHVLELPDQPVVQVDEDEEVVEKVTQYASMIVGVPLDCDVIGLSEPSPHWPSLKTFEIPISFAMREFHLGDLVEVKVGEHTGRIGVIVVLEGAHWVRICDVKDFASGTGRGQPAGFPGRVARVRVSGYTQTQPGKTRTLPAELSGFIDCKINHNYDANCTGKKFSVQSTSFHVVALIYASRVTLHCQALTGDHTGSTKTNKLARFSRYQLPNSVIALKYSRLGGMRSTFQPISYRSLIQEDFRQSHRSIGILKWWTEIESQHEY
ncbi:hypothetical protein C8R45DRAFT_935900 [Mycena sanguinolenta]|nr:hypothetical protein C8R45DRAFT_935900 [Mycena sanguinolenta]